MKFSSLKLLLFLFFIGCVDTRQHELLHWRNFSHIQSSLEVAWKDKPYREILLGNLKPEYEEFLHKNSDGSLFLYLSTAPGSLTWLTPNPKPKSIIPPSSLFLSNSPVQNPEYETKVIYTRSSFKEDETYKVERTTIMKSFAYSQDELFRSLNKISDTQTPMSKILETSTVQFLCDSFECEHEFSENDQVWNWRLKYTDRTKEKHPIFYSKTADRLKSLTMNLSFHSKDNPKEAVKFSNEGTNLLIQIPRKPGGIWKKTPNQVVLRSNLYIRSYGLRVKIEELDYHLIFKSKGNTKEILGRYYKLPKWEVGGRFLYIVPSGMIDFFIPGDIQTYFEEAFTLLTIGSDGNGGNQFHSKIEITGDKMKLTFVNKSEMLQKRFVLLGSSKKSDVPNDFLPALIDAALGTK